MDLESILNSKLVLLDSISPSKFIELEECTLRVALAAAGIPRLLPNGPAARLGSIIHKMFDFASKGVINNEQDFVEKWDALLAQTESGMVSNDLEKHFVPLSRNIRYFSVKRDSCFLGVQKIIELRKPGLIPAGAFTRSKSYQKSTGSELYFETSDRTVKGVIDSVYEGDDGFEIIDYKSGVIVEETADGIAIKNSYQIQLKIYAALYYLNTGVWPAKLKLLGINQQDFEVPFTPEECLQLIETAKQKLQEINSAITSETPWEELASPSPKACRFCPYRPVCKKYLELNKDGKGGNEWPLDFAGKILEKQEFKNGFRIVLEAAPGNVIIRALDTERHSSLNEPVENIMLFNLRPDTSPQHFIGSDFTTSYITPNSLA